MSTVLDKETQLDELTREVEELKKAIFYLTDTNTTTLTRLDVLSSKLTWSDNQLNILSKRLIHHLNMPRWHYEGQPVIK
jgi:hypothetical protein